MIKSRTIYLSIGLITVFTITFFLLGASPILKGGLKDQSYEPMEGDIIFQSSNQGQSLAIQMATESKYSHVGALFLEDGKWFVYEAVQPVRKTELKEFINRGDDGKYAVCRYSESLTSDQVSKMKSLFDKVEGKDYDLKFDWSDAKWYCSELVWKMFKKAGIQISEYETFADYNYENPYVQKIVEQRYKNGINMEDTIISPKGIYQSDLTKEIYSNY